MTVIISFVAWFLVITDNKQVPNSQNNCNQISLALGNCVDIWHTTANYWRNERTQVAMHG